MRSPKPKLIVFVVFTVLAALMVVLAILTSLADRKGGNATATVVHVYSQEAYTISYTTKDGERCVTPHKWNYRPQTVAVGDTFEVHYSSLLPCDNVERADDTSGDSVLIPVLLLIGGISMAVVFLLREKTQIRS